VGTYCLPHTCYVCVWCLSAVTCGRQHSTSEINGSGLQLHASRKNNGVGTSTSTIVVERVVSDVSKAIRPFETSGATRPSTQRDIPEGLDIQWYCCENLTSRRDVVRLVCRFSLRRTQLVINLSSYRTDWLEATLMVPRRTRKRYAIQCKVFNKGGQV